MKTAVATVEVPGELVVGLLGDPVDLPIPEAALALVAQWKNDFVTRSRGECRWLNSARSVAYSSGVIHDRRSACLACQAQRATWGGLSGPRSAPVPLLEALEARGVDLGPLLHLLLRWE